MLLTSITTVLGLLPMVFAVNIDLIGQDIVIGAPSSQWWTQLSSAIAGGLAFATLLTLVLTPCLLMLGENVSAWRSRRREARRPPPEEQGARLMRNEKGGIDAMAARFPREPNSTTP